MRLFIAVFSLTVLVGCFLILRPAESVPQTYHSNAGTTTPTRTTPTMDLNETTALQQMSDDLLIPRQQILEMSPRERAELSTRHLASKLNKTESEVRAMSAEERFDSGLRKLAKEKGVPYPVMRRVADLQQKFDSGQPLDEDEKTFLRRSASDFSD